MTANAKLRGRSPVPLPRSFVFAKPPRRNEGHPFRKRRASFPKTTPFLLEKEALPFQKRLRSFSETTAVVFKNDCGRFAKPLQSFRLCCANRRTCGAKIRQSKGDFSGLRGEWGGAPSRTRVPIYMYIACASGGFGAKRWRKVWRFGGKLLFLHKETILIQKK